MKWSSQQDNALQAISYWLKRNDRQVFHLFGYAGTGKTTMAKHIAQGVDGLVLFGAYTGKAAHVLQQKGCDGATTIHSMIYHTRDKSKAKLRDMELQLQKFVEEQDHSKIKELQNLIQKEKEVLKQPFFILNHDSEVRHAELVIIDECSMVNSQMAQDLLSFNTKVLVLGDPAQLPPVASSGYFTEGVTPDIMLEDIHRQAKESSIIQMATEVRNKRPLSLHKYDDGSCVIRKGSIGIHEISQFDQILVGKNKSRFIMNREIRKLKNYDDPYPIAGDKLVCLRNNYDEGLLNGAICHVVSTTGIMDAKVFMEIIPEDSEFSQETSAHEHHFLGSELQWFEKKEANEFDYGYALTVHKAQGSQWDDVFLLNEAHCFREDRWKWLYTGITRAAKKLTILQSN